MKRKTLSALWLLCSAACITYGINIMMLGTGTHFYAVWYAIGIVFLVFSAFAWFELWRKLPKIIKTAFAVLVVIGLSTFVITEGFIAEGFHEEGPSDLDYIIVLGAQIYETGPSVVLQYRLDKAVEYLNDNPDTVCIVSGGQGYNEPEPEGTAMKEYLVSNGISEDRVIAETKAESTEENLTYSTEYIEEGASIGIVTNDFHVYRSLQIADNLEIENVYGIAADSRKIYLPNNMLREFMAVVKMKLKMFL